MSESLFKFVVICAIGLGFTACGRSDRAMPVSGDPEVRMQEVERLNREIEKNPSDGTLYVAKMTILLAEDSTEDEARRLWKSLQNVQGGTAILVGLINHPVRNIRKNAIRLAGETHMTEALKPLRRRAEDRDPKVRRVALRALRELHDMESFELYVLLATDGDFEVRAAAAYAMGMFSTPEAVRRLSKLIADSDEYVQYRAAESLIDIAKPELKEEYLRIVEKSDNPLQSAAAQMALAKLGDHRGLVITMAIVRKHGHTFRTLAIRLLAKADGKRAVQLFSELLAEGETEADARELMKSYLSSAAGYP